RRARMRRRSGRVATIVSLVVGALLATTGSARAHVDTDAQRSTVEPDGTATVQFVFDHGCEGQPTTSLRVKIPEGVRDVQPQPVEGWQTAVTPTEFSWTGGSIPDSEPAVFVATMRVTGEQGTTIWFPAVQGCPTA